jgi:predicted extracellular nuclease
MNANVIVAGDFNEFTQTRSVLASINEVMTEIDEAAGLPLVERYTYVFDQNTEQLDHAFVSAAIANRTIAVEHVHVSFAFFFFLHAFLSTLNERVYLSGQ